MYGPLRDIFCDVLGYPRPKVVIDVAGEGGRPDVTCRAPSGLTDRAGKSIDIDWIVVEAKAEHHAFSSETKRELIFSKKSKYIGPDTAWFIMVDPTRLVARPTFSAELNALNDIEFRLDDSASEADFRAKFTSLAADRAGVPERLKSFRAGDTSLIATEKLIVAPITSVRAENQLALARRNFYSALRRTTQALQEATLQTLRSLKPELTRIKALVDAFKAKYNEYDFDPYTLKMTGKPTSYERSKSHAGDAGRLTRILRKAGSIARLALDGLPQFRVRAGIDNDDQALEMFAIETANLILARILVIRFFEDHGFFGKNRYVCNGGVAAFQKWREAFDQGYTQLLKNAYEKAQRVYAAAFDETELDWVFGTDDGPLSGAIEWAMYQLSRYDFTTVRGDILTGIYDRFLDREQRKRFGEYYTPPSIARYIIDRLKLSKTDKILDAACGSGTFLIERYQEVVGEDADRGIASYKDVVETINSLAGNDLNTFSAVLAQIQLLWHLLIFRDELMQDPEFPDIVITSKADSLTRGQLEASLRSPFAEIDQPIYGAVVGNPPYVRKERSGELDQATRVYFETPRSKPGNNNAWNGISPEANLYALFVYRALDSWCRPGDRWGRNAGQLGYVLPLAFCGSNENADLRRLFGPGGRWTIREIVDLEVIWRHVFDADVLPILLVCEARPPRLPLRVEEIEGAYRMLPTDPIRRLQTRAARLDRWMQNRRRRAHSRRDIAREREWTTLIARNQPRWMPDRITIKLPDKSCIDFYEGDKRPAFRLSEIKGTEIDYPDVFSPDGRLLTRLNEERVRIITRLRNNALLESAFQTYWYRRSRENGPMWQIKEPANPNHHWERREMVSRGLVFAGRKQNAPRGKGHIIYKAENIVTGEIYGEPQDVDIDIKSARNRYLFEFSDILPPKMWAVARIATCPNAVSFDPRQIAFTDTATIFAPRSDLDQFPFDLLLLSRIYRYYYVLSCRMSFLNLYRGDIYPTNLRLLPWNEALSDCAVAIESCRAPLISSCETAFRTEATMFAELNRLPVKPFKHVVRGSSGTKVYWSESFTKGTEKIEIAGTIVSSPADEGTHLQVSQYLFDWIEVTSDEIATSLKVALQPRVGQSIDRDTILELPIPVDKSAREAYLALVQRFRTADHQAAIDKVVDRLDSLVGPALGLSTAEIDAIRKDMMQDPFLKNIRPRYPATATRLHGYRTGLDSADRYD
jgi:hypothetical protein